MNWPAFLDIQSADAAAADVLLLPLPYEGSVSYGGGTAAGPQAVDPQYAGPLSTARLGARRSSCPSPTAG